MGNRVYFDGYTHEIKNGRDYIIAGGGMLTIDLPISEKDKSPVKISITCPSSYLDDFVKHGELVMALKEHRSITVGDCDIDIGMNRHDYDWFLQHFNEYSDRYKAYSIENNKKFYSPQIKVLDMNTLLYEPDEKGRKLSVNIDVWAYDNASNDIKVTEKQYKRR